MPVYQWHLSLSVGRGVLRGMTSELGLDIDKEHDLIGIAQYYVNNILKPHA